MAGNRSARDPLQALRRATTAIAAAIAMVTLGALGAACAQAVSEADQKCLSCHSAAGMEKKLEDGDTIDLQIAAEPFAKSVHSPVGCNGCHADVKLGEHPPADKKIADARSYSVNSIQLCRQCHADMFDQWQNSIHATLVKGGNSAAPICTDCHTPHAVMKGAAASLDALPCKNCHSEIYKSYLGSVHAKSRQASKESFAPLCAGCHTAHEVKPTAVGKASDGPEGACRGCHSGVLDEHRKWLPNAALHFDVVSCPACHVPSAQRRVDLLLIDAKSAQARGSEQAGVPLLDASDRSNGKGIDAQALWNLLNVLNRSGMASKTIVRGRLEAADGPQKHELADKTKAISDCHTCHSAGAKAFQSVTVSLAGPDGRRVNYGASPDILSSPISVDAVSGFYAIGGTRIQILDVLLILAIIGGLGVGVGHLALGWLFRIYGSLHAGGHGAKPGEGHGHKEA